MVGDSIVVPFQAVAGDVWQVQRTGTDLEWAGQHRVGPILLFQPLCRVGVTRRTVAR